MPKRSIFIAVLLTAALGCHSTAPPSEFFHTWGWENARNAKAHLNQHKNIIIVRIDEDHWENRGPHHLSLHHFQGTVIRCYRGDWHPAEPIAFVDALDYPAPRVAPNRDAGLLKCLLTNEHTHKEIDIEIGDSFIYDLDLERALQFLYP